LKTQTKKKNNNPNELIGKTFNRIRSEKRAAFVAYITAGDPDAKRCIQIADALVEAGIDILELGVPFSDPLADGEANQLAAGRAIAAGVTPVGVLDIAKAIRKKHPTLPIVLFTYINPVAHSVCFGGYCREAALCGVNAILPLDLPPEEADGYRGHIDNAGLGFVNLVAPTTSERRMKQLVASATAFVYYVAQEGVTGERKTFASGVSERIAMIKKHTSLPVVVGFGISSPEHVKEAAATGVDGVVVGSAIVRKVEAFAKGQGSIDDIRGFVKKLRKAL